MHASGAQPPVSVTNLFPARVAHTLLGTARQVHTIPDLLYYGQGHVKSYEYLLVDKSLTPSCCFQVLEAAQSLLDFHKSMTKSHSTLQFIRHIITYSFLSK